ncbi:Homoserine dehydrogenase [hydrothermal vent metagenome]|uniref:Homoserine dehydrogenase n=1 Tax=hydrothermal vent metagenome TaxID=652676 RepID=A0A3B1BZR6_9ZZZZ
MSLNIGIIGFGYWGPHLARNFNLNKECAVARIADLDQKRRKEASENYPRCLVSSDSRDITEANDIDIVAIATPVFSHFDLAMSALDNGKHVWIEKPIASSSEEAMRIVEKAESKNLIVIIDHTFLFTSAVIKMKEIIDEGLLGKLHYYDSVRANLGLFQHDVNVIWDLTTHDLAVIGYLLGKEPQTVGAVGSSHFNSFIDIGYVTLHYENDFIAHFHANWLSPLKIRKSMISGDRNMLVWDENEREEKIKIYNKGVNIVSHGAPNTGFADYRVGEVHSPLIMNTEALKTEVEYFVSCLSSGVNPHNNAIAGYNVMKILEATDKSLKLNGSPVELK